MDKLKIKWNEKDKQISAGIEYYSRFMLLHSSQKINLRKFTPSIYKINTESVTCWFESQTHFIT